MILCCFGGRPHQTFAIIDQQYLTIMVACSQQRARTWNMCTSALRRMSWSSPGHCRERRLPNCEQGADCFGSFSCIGSTKSGTRCVERKCAHTHTHRIHSIGSLSLRKAFCLGLWLNMKPERSASNQSPVKFNLRQCDLATERKVNSESSNHLLIVGMGYCDMRTST